MNTAWKRFFARLTWGDIMIGIILVIFVLVIMFPFWWVLRTALTSPGKVFTDASSLLPVDPTLLNFRRVLGSVDASELVAAGNSNISTGTLNFWLYLRNSFIFSMLVTLGQTTFSTMAAYAFARFRFPGRNRIFFLYLTGLMIPGIVLFIPNFVFIRQTGLTGTFAGLVAPFFLMTPYAVFFMRQFFLGLNKDLEEAATLDGATRVGIFWRVALPLVQGPILTLGILTFIQSWNEYLWPLLVGRDENIRVLTVALAIFRQQTPQGSPDWTGLMAGTAVAIVPTVLIFLFFGRKVVDSIQFSGFK
ncbi:carbohydrate ABC transporter permease [Phototrophicus methaneseepsis]|uniref:Carbohydrate ABC transporter permease n=2 Tax=Phototrophicus methaneseepsis TaxID=2710758 RepID=A0A7S8EE99_9CHLR|nr:carbohydrate ABC transporter permease [Phototrophicus methaneseepsis]